MFSKSSLLRHRRKRFESLRHGTLCIGESEQALQPVRLVFFKQRRHYSNWSSKVAESLEGGAKYCFFSFCYHIRDTFASCLHSKTATAFAKYQKKSAKTGQFIQNGIHCLICLASILARIRAVACMRAITALSSAS